MFLLFAFNAECFLNETVFFDTSKVNEEQIIDRILENVPGESDDVYLIHMPGTNAFSLRCEDGK